MNTIDIASRRELFVDHHLIDELSGTAHLKMHSPKREEVGDRPLGKRSQRRLFAYH
ncbi:MAG: hypothetical protein ACYTGH_20875 [Planctomycetota bacterium]|jgi:hypothetical protein